MKTLFQVLTMVACGVVPIVIVFMLFINYLTMLHDKAIYVIVVLIILYYSWYVSIGINKVKSWFV